MAKKASTAEWAERLSLFEKFLDVKAILMLRQTSKFFYLHQYKPGNSTLSFSSLRGYEAKILCDELFPLVCSCVDPSVREGLVVDFTRCALIKDAFVARIVDLIYGSEKENAISGKVRVLNFDFCYQITDKGLSAMLTSDLPGLEQLSVRCARSKHLTGMPFCTELDAEKWPRFSQFACSFSNIWLEPVNTVAAFVTETAKNCGTVAKIEMFGSWASRCYLEKIQMYQIAKKFCQAVKGQNLEALSILTKKVQKELSNSAEDFVWRDYPLYQLLKDCGSELLANLPLKTCEDDGSNIWTLPLCVSIEKQDMRIFNLLLKRGAKVDVWDYLGKSPLSRACEVGRKDFVETLVEHGTTYSQDDMFGQSALELAIRRGDTSLVKLLLKNGGVLDYKCPSLKAFKSPLFIACEVGASDVMQLFLEAGADPNWKSAKRCTPTLLAYQLNNNWLESFMSSGAGATEDKRWVLTEVLTCAILKMDMRSIELLIRKYPDLLSRPHHLWSLPHIQAAKLGHASLLEFFLDIGSDVNATGIDGVTALHVATEEGFEVCVEKLIDRGVDISKVNAHGQTSLHIACLENRYAVAERLLRSGCKIDCLDQSYGETPLMTAIRTRNCVISMLILRLAHNFNCDTMDIHGRTALTYAIFFGQYDVADVLMDIGADVTLTDKFGKSAYLIVAERLVSPGSDKRILKKYLKLYKSKCTSTSKINIAKVFVSPSWTQHAKAAPAPSNSSSSSHSLVCINDLSFEGDTNCRSACNFGEFASSSPLKGEKTKLSLYRSPGTANASAYCISSSLGNEGGSANSTVNSNSIRNAIPLAAIKRNSAGSPKCPAEYKGFMAKFPAVFHRVTAVQIAK